MEVVESIWFVCSMVEGGVWTAGLGEGEVTRTTLELVEREEVIELV